MDDLVVYRNILLKGIISKEKAIELLGLNRQAEASIRGFSVEISRDDFEEIWISIKNEGFGQYERI